VTFSQLNTGGEKWGGRGAGQSPTGVSKFPARAAAEEESGAARAAEGARHDMPRLPHLSLVSPLILTKPGK